MRYSFYIIVFISLLASTANGQQLSEHPRIQSEIITTEADEIILKQSFTVDAPVQKVWPYFTQTELYTKWSAPVASINFKINGTIKANYSTDGNLESEDTITIHILNYIPEKLITLQSEIPASFPAFMKENEKDFYNVIEFNETDTGGTQVISYGLGYNNNAQFKQMIGFFAKGNLESYQKLINLLE
ncbi:MAG: SRPBCC domain-containing protein [Balneolaceae bacterium]|nr:SRPBCC domain-containing protein [Balneolaceae bacterium]